MITEKVNTSENQSKSTNYKHINNLTNRNNSHNYKIVNVQCINNFKIKDGNMELIHVRTYFRDNMKPGDIFYGYDLTSINNNDMDGLQIKNCPDIILVKKKFIRQGNKRVWKLKHLDMEQDTETNKKSLKNFISKEDQYEEFLRDIEENKHLRKNVNLYKVWLFFKLLD